MTKLTVVLHPSIKFKGIPRQFEGEFSGKTLISAIDELLQPYPQLRELALKSGKKRPGILYISQGAELASLGMLDIILDGDEKIEVKIVPILHGG